MNAIYDIAERALVNLPIGSVIKISAATSSRNFYYQHQDTGIVQISCGAYCRAIGA